MPEQIRLRDVLQTDLPFFFENQRDPEAVKMAAFPARDEEAFYKHWAKIMASDTVYNQTILYNEQVAGSISTYEMEGETEIGYWIGKEFWGKGIMSEALKQFLGIALSESKGQVKKRPLFSHVAKHNLASKRVLEKCGFQVIGEGKWNPFPNEPEVEEFIFRLD